MKDKQQKTYIDGGKKKIFIEKQEPANNKFSVVRSNGVRILVEPRKTLDPRIKKLIIE